MPQIAYIYVITNLVNGKKYVGVTTSLKRRIEFHLSGFSDCGIAVAVKKHGRKNFVWEVVCCTRDVQYAYRELEPYFIDIMESYAPLGKGYNFTKGGEGAVGIVISEESRKKISLALRGKTIPESVKAKISEANKITKSCPERRRRNSELHTGSRNAMYGKRHPEHVQKVIKEKLSVLNSGDKNPAARSIVVKGIRYSTFKEAASALGMSKWQFFNWRKKNESQISY